MMKKLRFILIMILINTFITLGTINAEFNHNEGGEGGSVYEQQNNVGKQIVKMSGEIVNSGGSSVEFNIGVVGSKKHNVTKKPASSPSCYVWYKAGSGTELFEKMPSIMYGDTSREENIEGTIEYIAKELENGNEELAESTTSALIKSLETKTIQLNNLEAIDYDLINQDNSHLLGTEGNFNINISKVSGNVDLLREYYTYRNGSIEDANFDILETTSVYYVLPNPVAYKEFDINGTESESRCGKYPGANTATMFITGKHVAGTKVDQGTVKNIANSQLSVKVKEIEGSKGIFEAQAVYNDKNITPEELEKATFVWMVRVPDEKEPDVKTSHPSDHSVYKNKVISDSDNSISNLSYPLNYESNSDINPKSEIIEMIKKSFDDNNIKAINGDKYTIDFNNIKFESENAREKLKIALDNEPQTISLIENGSITDAFGVVKVSTPKNVKLDNGTITDTIDLSSELGALTNGKYVVSVAVVVHGTYDFKIDPFDPNKYVKFNYPLGYVADVAVNYSGSCATLQSSFSTLAGKEVGTVDALVSALEQKLCKEEVWSDPIGRAKLTTLEDGKVQLNASGSKGAIQKEKTFKYIAKTQTKCVGPVSKFGGCATKDFYTGATDKIQVGKEVTTKYPIVKYTWSKDYRVYNEFIKKYELELEKSDTTNNSIRTDGRVYKNNTFACVVVETTAPSPHKFSSVPTKYKNIRIGTSATNDGVAKKDKAVEEIKSAGSGKSPCDVILLDEASTRVIENWK